MKVYRIELKKYKKGFCPTICNSLKSAENVRKNLELQTGMEWKITEIETDLQVGRAISK